MTEELKPCPFCGSKNVWILCPSDHNSGEKSCVSCHLCHARGPEIITATTGNNSTHDLTYAFKSWNTRYATVGEIKIYNREIHAIERITENS